MGDGIRYSSQDILEGIPGAYPRQIFRAVGYTDDEMKGPIIGIVSAYSEIHVIRYEGPKGGPGMREMSIPAAVLVGMVLGDSVAMITDGRFSEATRGPCIGHICVKNGFLDIYREAVSPSSTGALMRTKETTGKE